MPKWPNGDTTEMTLLQKGEILYLNSIGKTKKEIAGLTGRSMAWIEDVVAALAGTKAREDLIASYNEAIKGADKKGKKQNEQMPQN